VSRVFLITWIASLSLSRLGSSRFGRIALACTWRDKSMLSKGSNSFSMSLGITDRGE
jgi:hypothetical protein